MSAHDIERRLLDWLRREGISPERDSDAADPHIDIGQFETAYHGNMSVQAKRAQFRFDKRLNLRNLAEAIANGDI